MLKAATERAAAPRPNAPRAGRQAQGLAHSRLSRSAGLLVAINALNGSLGTPLWAARRELLLALIAADLVSMARIGLLLRRMRRRQ